MPEKLAQSPEPWGGPNAEDSRLVGSNADFAVATIGSYVLLVWRKRIALQGALWAKKAFADQRRLHPNDKISFLTVAQADCDLTTPADVRRELAEVLRVYKDDLASAAIAFEGGGFRMTMVRSVITAVYMATYQRFPNAVFGSTTEALAWLHERSAKADSKIRIQQLIVTLERIRKL
jgi:hypothetical protein